MRREAPLRRRLSGLDLLPASALPDLQWAHDRVVEARMTQTAICRGLNARLAAKGMGPVSRSAFGRWTVSLRDGWRGRPALIGNPADTSNSGGGLAAAAAQLRAIADDLDRLAADGSEAIADVAAALKDRSNPA